MKAIAISNAVIARKPNALAGYTPKAAPPSSEKLIVRNPHQHREDDVPRRHVGRETDSQGEGLDEQAEELDDPEHRPEPPRDAVRHDAGPEAQRALLDHASADHDDERAAECEEEVEPEEPGRVWPNGAGARPIRLLQRTKKKIVQKNEL